MTTMTTEHLMAKADKIFRKGSGWFSSDLSKYEEAGDLYQQAANAFKGDKRFKEAGDAHKREADCRDKCGERLEAANSWWSAAKAYEQGYPDLAISALGAAVSLLTAQSRFRQAADREKEIGQLYLQGGDLGRACESLERAGEWYAQEDAQAIANACFKDAADLHAEQDKFPQAIQRYEQIADHELGSDLTKCNVKDYWLRAGLCALAWQDLVTAKRNHIKYCRTDVSFASTHEAKFFTALLDATEVADEEAFTAAVIEYNEIAELGSWKTMMLLKIKRTIRDEVICFSS